MYNFQDKKSWGDRMNGQQKQWIANLYREMYDHLLQYANGILKDPLQAEEAIQETFRIACDKYTLLMGSANPRGWVMNTLKGVLQNQQRRNRKQSNLFVQMEDSELPRDGAPDTVALDVLYGDMADSQEFQLLVAVSEGETVKEIAQRMGISEDSCKKRVQRSRKYLKRVMEKE